MAAPTVAVTVKLAAQDGPGYAGITVRAKLDINDVYLGFVISDEVTAVTDATGTAVLQCFPNALADETSPGLGTTGSVYRFTAQIPGGRKFDVRAVIPNTASNLEDCLIGGEATMPSLASKVRATALTGLNLSVSTAITAADTVLSAAGKLQSQITTAATNLATNVRATELTGLSLATVAVINATDTVLSAAGKLQAQITDVQAQITAAANNLPANVRGTVLTGIDLVTATAVTAADTVMGAIGKLWARAEAIANKTDMTKGVALVGGAGRVVDSIAALRALPKTGSPRASLTGYYAAGDGGGDSDYWLDAADTTSGAYFTGSSAPIAAPAAPALSSAASGTLAARTYYVRITYVSAAGETVTSAESSLALAVNTVLVVTSPAAATGATGYNVYVHTTSGSQTKQNATPIAIATNWAEPNTGLITGSAMPAASTAGSVLTVAEVTNGTVTVGHIVFGTGVSEGTSVVAQISGTGGTGTYTVNISQTIAGGTVMGSSNGGTIIVAEDGGRWKLIYDSSVSSAQFGVRTDGTNAASNTARFQAAVTWCQDNLVGLDLSSSDPSQVIALSGKINITKPLRMTGAGLRYTTLMGVGLVAGTYLLDIDGTVFGSFDSAEIGGFTLMPGTGVDCARIKNASLSKFMDIGLRDCRNGIDYTGTRCFSNDFGIHSVTAVAGYTFKFLAHTGGGGHTFYHSTFGGDTGLVIDADTITDTVVMYSPNFEQCTTNSGAVFGTVRGLSLLGGRTEGCNGEDFNFAPATGKVLVGLNVKGITLGSSDNGAAARINLGGAGKIRGFDISGNNVAHGTSAFAGAMVKLNGNGESGVVSGNFLDGALASCSVVDVQRPGVKVFGNEAKDGRFLEWDGMARAGIENFDVVPVDASGAALAFTTAGGFATRIGPMVYYQITVIYPTTTNTAAATIGGLPIDILAGGALQGRAGASIDLSDSTIAVAVTQLTGTKTIRLDKVSLGGAATNADVSGKSFYISGSYRIA